MTEEKKKVLRELYKMLMGGTDAKSTIRRRKDFCEYVKSFVAKSDKTDSEKEKFYESLVYAQSNGVAGLGQAITGCPRDKRLVLKEEEAVFTDLLSKDNLDSQTYCSFRGKFFEAIKKKDPNGKKQPVIFNRIIAAIFPKQVTPIPNEDRFEEVYSWMLENGFLEPDGESSAVTTSATDKDSADDKDMNWYEKNQLVMNAFNEAFTAEFRESVARTEQLPEISEYAIGKFSWQLREFICSAEAPSNLVKYGAPGTGKTFTAESEARLRFLGWRLKYGADSDLKFEDTYEFVQFHPSYGYEDFIEGLKPLKDSGRLFLQEGNFKAFCREAGKWECDLRKLGLTGDDLVLKPTAQKLKSSKAQKTLEEEWDKIKNDNEVWPRWKFLEEKFKLLGASTTIADVMPPFTFVIDEINRAELSRVFGELMYCLEYRGWEHAIKTQYAHLDDKPLLGVDGASKFFIPRNVYIVGTMNTIDKSVESFDYALRRRFVWEEVEPDSEIVADYLRGKLGFTDKIVEKILEGINELNEKIAREPLLGPDYRIGHAYFMKVRPALYQTIKIEKKKKYLTELWEKHIRHLLFEYLRGTGQEKRTGRQKCLMDDFKETLFQSNSSKDKNAKKNVKKKDGGEDASPDAIVEE